MRWTDIKIVRRCAVYKNEKFYVLVNDFSKAYYGVPRDKLLERLRERGYGKVKLQAIKIMYVLMHKEQILQSVFARDLPLVFVMYIDHMLLALNRGIVTDSLLGSLHI